MRAPNPMSEHAATDWLAPRKAVLEHAWGDRDYSWLEFNRRVLHEAQDDRTPLLERLKFLAIFTSNLDEFYMKHVGMLRGKARAESEDDPVAPAGDSRERLATIRSRVQELLAVQASCYRDLRSRLAGQGIVLADWDALDEAQREEAGRYFDINVSPALTPLGFDPTHPFPFISNLSTNWGFLLRAPGSDQVVPVRVKSPTILQQWIPLHANVPAGERRFLSLEDLIRHNAAKLFPGMEIESGTLFRILRNAEVELEEDEGETLREAVIEALRERRFQPVVRIDFAPNAAPEIRRALVERFDLDEQDIYEMAELIDYTDLFQIAALDLPELRDPPWTPLPPARLPDEDGDIFAAIGTGDVLVHHPYESFDDSVERFIDEAADDPQTVAIKMTVYRVGDDTPFVRSLIRAAEAGRQVACIVEVKARFDEARNLYWAQELEKVGAHVVYGVLGLKTHTKLALVVRKEGGGLRCYAHIGTGNYHVRTARLYTDVGLFTCDPELTADVVNLFHYFTGRSITPTFGKLLVAPMDMRERFLQLIRREVEHARAGRPARIVAKMNQLEDMTICRALVAASQAGVHVDLVIRGFCCLRPGVSGWTENVRVRSVIGRFLEHSRIFHFADGSDDPLEGEYYIGSADWMYRNLSRRVEAATPVVDRGLRERLWEILDTNLRDRRQAWLMQSDGSYRQLEPSGEGGGPEALGTQMALMESARRRVAARAAWPGDSGSR
jgi:polyphosphate kinase